MKKLENIYCFIFFFALIAIDQLSKYLVRPLDGFYICNTGISFGIQLPAFVFWFLWIAIIGFLIYFIVKKASCFDKIVLIFILAGATSNIIDRLCFGCVIDFIDLKIWPVFNFADIFISIGAIWLILKNLKSK